MTDLGKFTGTNKARSIAVANKKKYTAVDFCALFAAFALVAYFAFAPLV